MTAMDQMVKLLAQQQEMVQQQSQQIAQLLANHLAPNGATNQETNPIPSLPDISPFEPTDDKSRVLEWLDRFKFALDCAAPTAKDEIKVKCLMNKLSETAFSEYNRSVLPSAVTDFNFATTVQRLEKLFAKPQSIFIDRYECLKAMRGEGEEFRQFINRQRRLLADFKFDELKKEQFNCLMLLTALKSPNEAALRQRILAKLSTDGANVTYDGVVNDLINFQSTIAEARAIEVPIHSRNINAMHKKGKQGQYSEKNVQKNGTNNSTINKSWRASEEHRPDDYRQKTWNCWRCGGEHRSDDCRHILAKCYKCEFTGHLARQCEAVQEWRRQLHADKSDDKRVGYLKVGSGMRPTNSAPPLKTEILLNDRPVQIQLDTGSDVNIIDERTYNYIGRPAITKCNEIGKTFDGTEIRFVGKGTVICEFNGYTHREQIYVAKHGAPNLMSCKTMDNFGLLDDLKQKICGVTTNSKNTGRAQRKKFIPKSALQTAGTEAQIQAPNNSFPKGGKRRDEPFAETNCHLPLKNDAQQIQPKAAPDSSMDALGRELRRLEELGIIRKVKHGHFSAKKRIFTPSENSAIYHSSSNWKDGNEDNWEEHNTEEQDTPPAGTPTGRNNERGRSCSAHSWPRRAE